MNPILERNSMSKDYMLNRIAKCGYKITMLGKNIKAERQYETHVGSIRKVYLTIFRDGRDKLIKRLEHELEVKNEYIKGLEELLYNKITSK